MLPSAPVVMTIVFGGAGRMKCSVIQIATRRSSRNDPYVSARSRQETCEILKRGMKGFGTLAALAVGSPTRARTWDRTCGDCDLDHFVLLASRTKAASSALKRAASS